MKKMIKIAALGGMLASLGGCVFMCAGCSSTKVEVNADGGWSVTSTSHWLKRDVDSFRAKKSAEGVEVEFNGYKSDTSEQLAKNAAEFWYGVSVLGRLAGTVFNPAVASVPLDKGAANAADTAALVNAASNAETAKIAAKAAEKGTAASAKCATGKCTDGTCEDCTVK